MNAIRDNGLKDAAVRPASEGWFDQTLIAANSSRSDSCRTTSPVKCDVRFSRSFLACNVTYVTLRTRAGPIKKALESSFHSAKLQFLLHICGKRYRERDLYSRRNTRRNTRVEESYEWISSILSRVLSRKCRAKCEASLRLWPPVNQPRNLSGLLCLFWESLSHATL